MCFMFQYSANLTDKPKTSEAGAYSACILYLSVLMMLTAFVKVLLPAKYECRFNA